MGAIGGLGSLFQGIAEGKLLHMQLQRARDEHEAHMRQQQRDEQQSQVQDIQNQMMIQGAGRPVTGNGVPESFEAATPSSVPGTSDASQTVNYVRPVDKSRLLTYKTRDGRTIQSEAFTPEEQMQKHLDAIRGQGLANAQGAGMADVVKRQMETGYHESELKRRGVAAPDLLVNAGIAQRGQMLLPEEIRPLIQEAQKVLTPEIKEGPGGIIRINKPMPGMSGVQQAPDPSQAGLPAPDMVGLDGSVNPLAAAAAPAQQARQNFVQQAKNAGQQDPGFEVLQGPKQTPEEDYADAFAKTLGKPSRKEMSQSEWNTALGQYKTANTDPEARAAMLATRASADASRTLANTLRQIQVDQAPTREQAADLADDLINHRLAPDQISQIRVRGNGGLGLMIYTAAKKKDPEFSWEKASGEYQLSKSPAFQQNVRYMDSVSESIPLVIERAKKLDNMGVKGIAALINAGKNQFNDIDLKKFQTDSTLVADEIAKIMQGGGTGSGTSDAKLRQASEILGKNDSPKAIAAALADVQQLIGFRRKALTKGTYLESATPAPAMAGGGAATHRFNPATGQIEAK